MMRGGLCTIKTKRQNINIPTRKFHNVHTGSEMLQIRKVETFWGRINICAHVCTADVFRAYLKLLRAQVASK